MECPHCKLFNPDSAQRCDCGYDFSTGVVEQSFLTKKTEVTNPRRKGQEGKLSKSIVLPKKHFWTMAIINFITWFALGVGVFGQDIGSALGSAFGTSIGMIAGACLFSMVPGGIYWLFKRQRMPGLTGLIWIIWAVMYGSYVLQLLGAAQKGG